MTPCSYAHRCFHCARQYKGKTARQLPQLNTLKPYSSKLFSLCMIVVLIDSLLTHQSLMSINVYLCFGWHKMIMIWHYVHTSQLSVAKPFKWMLQGFGSPLLEECIFSQQGYLNLRLLEHSLGNQDHHCKVWSLLVLIYFIGLLLDLELVKCGLVKSGSYLYTEDLLALDMQP